MKKFKAMFRLFCIPIYILLITSFTVMLLPIAVKAQENKGLPFITNYRYQDYDADGVNWWAAEDDRGVMYFANGRGILVYDGQQWETVVPPGNVETRSLVKGKDGKIYVGTNGDIGYIAQGKKGKLEFVSLKNKIPEKDRKFNEAWETQEFNGDIFFRTTNKIFRWNGVDIKVYDSKEGFHTGDVVNGQYYVRIWGRGLTVLKNDSFQVVPNGEKFANERIYAYIPYDKNRMLIGTRTQGLFIYDGIDFIPFKTEADPYLVNKSLYGGILLSNGNFAFNNFNDGIVIIDKQGKLVQVIDKTVGLMDNAADYVFEDSRGILWIPLFNGIAKFDLHSSLTFYNETMGLPGKAVFNIGIINDTVYAGTNTGVYMLNKNINRFEKLAGSSGQIGNFILNGNDLLVAAADNGLQKIKAGKIASVITSVNYDFNMNGFQRSKKDTTLFYCSLRSGMAIVKYNPVNSTYSILSFNPDITIGGAVTIETEEGNLWIIGENPGEVRLLKFYENGVTHTLEKVPVVVYNSSHGLPVKPVNMLEYDGKAYYFSEKDSIFVFDKNQNKFIQDKNVLWSKSFVKNVPGTIIHNPDHLGRIWANAGSGVFVKLPTTDGSVKIVDAPFRELRKNYPVWGISPTIDKNGKEVVWFTSNEGIIRYDGNLTEAKTDSIRTIIRGITLNEDSVFYSGLDLAANEPDFSYKWNTVRFQFAAPFFKQENETLFSTYLDGWDKGWSEWSKQNFREFGNLSGGTYTFRVKSKNIYDVESAEVTYTFSVSPPWYGSLWAYILYAIAAIAIIYAIVLWRTHQLHEKHRELEKTVAERTYQLSHRVEELAVINSVQEGLVSEMNMQGIYELVGEKIREIFNAQVIDIATYDSSTNIMEDHYAYEKGDRTLVGKWEPKAFRKHVIETKQLLLINEDLDKKSIEFGGGKAIHGQEPKSAVFVPMISGGNVTGMISLQNLDKENAFSDSSVSLLTTLANSMSVALESARRFDETTRLLKETEQRTAELAVINSVQDGLARELDIHGIYKLVGDRLCTLFPDSQTLVIRTFNHVANQEYFEYFIEKGEDMKVDPRPFMWANKQLILSKQPLLINEHYLETAKKYGGTGVTKGQPPKSAVFVPMIVGEVVKGSISLQNVDKEFGYSDSDLRLLTTLTNSMSVALENARLFDETNRLLKETEQRTAELAVINSVQDGLAKELDMQAIYDLVGTRLYEMFDTTNLVIRTFDHESGKEQWRYAIEKGERQYIEPKPFIWANKQLIQTRKPIHINENYVETAKKHGGTGVSIGHAPKSAVFVPMVVGDVVKGSVSLQNVDKENAYTEADLRLLTTLTNSMSVALENARLFDETNRLLKETEQRNAELAVINSVQDGLVREMDMQGIYELVGEKIREIFDAQVIDIVTYDKKTNLIEDRYAYEKGDRSLIAAREPKGFRRHVIETKTLLLHNENVEQAMKDYNNEILIGEMPKSQVYVPMIAGSEVNGIISLQNIDHEQAFSESDVRLLNTLANSMSIALESARLFDETKRLLKETEQRNAELAVINSVQDGLVREMDMEGIYELVGEKIREIFDAQVIDIVMYDRKTKMIEDRYSYEKGDRTLLGPRKPFGFRKHVIENKVEMMINKDLEKLSVEYNSPVIQGETPKSMIMVPMIAGSNVTGIISLQNIDHEDAFSESDARLINTLANTMSIALESARLFDETKRLLKETKQRNAELAVINSVQDGLVREMDMQGIYELVGEKIREIFDAQVIDIVTYDSRTNLIEDRYSYEKGDRSLLGPRAPKGFRKHVIDTGQLLLHNDNVERAMREFDNEILIGEVPKSQVYVPMITGGDVNGIISLQNIDHEHAFSESDIRLINTLANTMSIALGSARLFDETKRLLKETEQRTAELSVINSVQEGLVREMDIQGIYNLVGEKMRAIFNAQVFDIVTYDKTSGLIEDRYTYEKGDRTLLGPRPLKGFRKHVIEKAAPLVINNNLSEQRLIYDQKVLVGEGAKSIVLVPMIAGGEATGVISLQNIDEENAFPDSDVRLLGTLASSMSVALENARLFDETTRLLKETEQRTAELAVINSVQDGLATELDIQGIYNLVGDRIRDLFDAQVVAIATFNHEDATEKFQYIVEKGERFYPEARPFDKLRTHLIATRQKILINSDFIEAYNKFGMKAVSGTALPKSALFVPLSIGDKITSYVTLQNIDKENAFSDSDVRLLETLANSMSVALENARLFDETTRLLKETEQRTAELAVINSVQEGLAKELDMQGIYNMVGDRLCSLFPDTQILVIRTFEHDTGLEHWQYVIEKGTRFYNDPSPFTWANKQLIQTKKYLHINENYVETAKKYGGTGVAKGQPPKSAIFVPMIVGDLVKGSVSLQNVDRENAFNNSDIRLLTTITNSMSVALENARLFDETNRLLKETEQRTAELAVINSVQDGLAKELDMQGIYDLVGDRVQKLFNAQVVLISTFDLENKTEHFNYFFENNEKVKAESRPINKLRQLLIDKKHTIHIATEDEAIKEYGITAIGDTKMPKSFLFVPLLTGIIIRGYVSLQNIDIENAFSESDIRLLETLANSMSVALENARLFDETNRLLKETEQRTAELAVINSVQEGLVREMDMQGIYNLVGDRVQTLFNAQVVLISTFDLENKTEHFNYFFENNEKVKAESRPINKLRQLLIDKKHTIHIATEEEAIKDYGLSAIGDTKMTKSMLFVPLLTGSIIRGYVSLQNIDIEHAFSESDIRLLETLANSMSVALENARLFDETNRLLKETEQRTAELAVINSVQDGLAKELDIQGIYDLVGDRLCDLFPDTQTLVIRTFDHDTGLEYWQYAKEKGERLTVEPRPFMWANQQLIRTKKPIDIEENYVRTAQKFGGSGVTKGKPPKSAVFVPMIVGDVVRGSISLQNVDRENAFNESDLRLLTTITNSMSVALENARLFDETHRLLKETEQRTAELAVINSVQDGLVREMNMQAIYDLVGNRICELFDTQTVLIRTFDHRTGQEIWQYVIEKGERLYSNPRPIIWANKRLIESKESLLINENYLETAQKFGGSGVSKGLPPKSALFVPMIVGDVVKGSVSLQNVEKENAFTDSDLRLLTTLTNSMSVALENARLFDESNRLLGDAKQRASELATVNNITQALASQINLEELIELVGDEIRQLFKANIIYLALLDKETNIINFPYQHGDELKPLKLGEGLTSKIIKTGEPLLINKDVEELRKQMGIKKSVGIPAASYLGVPISVGDEVIGVLSVQSTEHENKFNEDDLRLLQTIATSVGVALRKAKLFEEIHLAKMDAEEAKKTAERANDAKSAFLSTVSHELRTPLTSVLGFAKIIKKRLDEKIFPITDKTDPKTVKTIKQIADNLDVVVSEGQRLTHLINDVLDLAKIEAGKMEWNSEPVSIPEIAERAIAATTALFDANNLKLVKDIKTDIPDITGDKDKLIQVMVNLISNAVKFSLKGKVTIKVYKEKDEIIASITDTGIGIAPEDHAAVFEQFKQVGDTLTDKPKGTGLGLPICKEIVEHHAGRIWLESELGKGSTFYVGIPITKSATDTDRRPIHLEDLVKQLKEQVAHSQLNIIGKAASILVVDDDDSIRSLLHQELGEAGYEIVEASNGKEALECVRKQRPDLIILDIMMPEMNGFDVAAVLKNDPNTMDIPIIVLSIVQDKTRGFRIGVDRYLTKPIDTGLLFNEIGSLLEQGKSKKKVMIVDEDGTTVNTLTDVLKAKGYTVMESNGKELMEKAIANQPDIIIMNSVLSDKQDVVKSLRFEKGMENVLFLVYQ